MQADESDERKRLRTAGRVDWRAGTLLILALSVLGWLVVALVVWLLWR